MNDRVTCEMVKPTTKGCMTEISNETDVVVKHCTIYLVKEVYSVGCGHLVCRRCKRKLL